MQQQLVNLNNSAALLSASAADLTIIVWQRNTDNNNRFEQIEVIDAIESLQVIYKYVKPSSFTLKVPYTAEQVQQLAVGNMITFHSPQTLGLEQTECFIITFIEVTKKTSGTTTITVTGSNPLYWLKDRLVLTTNDGYSNTSAESIAKDYVINNLGSGASTERQYPNFEVQAIQDYPGTITFMNTSQYPTVYSVCSLVLNSANLGQTITFNPTTQTFMYEVLAGSDHSLSQSENIQVLFSPSLDNLDGDQFTHSIVDFKNVAYVYAQIDNTVVYDIVKHYNQWAKIGEKTTTYTYYDYDEEKEITKSYNTPIYGQVTKSYTEKKYQTTTYHDEETIGNFIGLDRREMAVSGDLSHGSTTTLTQENYQNIFPIIGENALIRKAETKNLLGSIKLASDSAFKFNQDFQIGDTVTYLNQEWGVQMNVVVSEVRLQYSAKGFVTQLSLGYPLPTLEDKLGITLS